MYFQNEFNKSYIYYIGQDNLTIMFPRITNIFMKIVVLVMIVYEVVGWTRHDEIRTGI